LPFFNQSYLLKTLGDGLMMSRMQKSLIGLAALGYVLLFAGATASQKLDDVPSFRCDGQTVSVGDRSYTVMDACGVPQKIRISGGGAVEDWVYNFGPNKFIYYVTFVNGRLERIQAGEYGFENNY
jgi:hypothetical protein